MRSKVDIQRASDREIQKHLCQLIKIFRFEKNISQELLAQQMDVHTYIIAEIEKGKPMSVLFFIQLLRRLEKLYLLTDIIIGVKTDYQAQLKKGNARKKPHKSG